jgi:hypothetical protein
MAGQVVVAGDACDASHLAVKDLGVWADRAAT